MKMKYVARRQLELPLKRPDRAMHPNLSPEHRSELLRALSEMLVAVATVRQPSSTRRSVDEVAKVDR